MELGAVLVKEN